MKVMGDAETFLFERALIFEMQQFPARSLPDDIARNGHYHQDKNKGGCSREPGLFPKRCWNQNGKLRFDARWSSHRRGFFHVKLVGSRRQRIIGCTGKIPSTDAISFVPFYYN